MFCVKCGKQLSGERFCPHCGEPQPSPPPQPGAYEPPRPGAYEPQPFTSPNMAQPVTDGFAGLAYQYGGSTLFLVGILLFTVGNLVNILRDFSGGSIFSLALTALPVIGFWLIFAASKSRGQPSQILPATTLFKVYLVIGLIFLCLVTLILLLVSVIIFSAGVPELGIVFLLVTAVVVLFIVLYYKSVLSVVGGVRRGMLTNTAAPLSGVSVFSVLTYIGAGFGALGALISAAAATAIDSLIGEFYDEIIGEFLYEFPDMMQDFVWNSVSGFGGGMAVGAVLTLMSCVGTIICVAVLNRFNNSLKYRG